MSAASSAGLPSAASRPRGIAVGWCCGGGEGETVEVTRIVEVTRVVEHWRTWYTEQEPVLYVEGVEEPFPATGEPPWEQTLAAPREEERDELLQKAIDVVRARGQASASLLQRRMHIGYPRASRLIDEMHALGIVGPPESGGKPRRVLELSAQQPESTGGGSG